MQPCPECQQPVLQMAEKCRHCGASLDEETLFLNEGQMLAEIQAIQAEAQARESRHQSLQKSVKLQFAVAPVLLIAGLALVLASGQTVLEVLGAICCGGGVVLTFLAVKAVRQLNSQD